jgi:two-component system, OmpR family, sensor kinase
VRAVWERAGLRARLAVSFGAIVLVAFAALLVAVRLELSDESAVIDRGVASGSGEDLAAIPDAQDEVARTLVIVGAVTLGAALLAGYLVAARTAAPLRRMASTAAAVDAGDLSPRIGPDPGSAVELRTLAEAFDHMLDRLDDAFARQRQFVSDASHELRTPLTGIRGQLELLRRDPDPSPADVSRVERAALRELARVERLVADLLTLASLEEAPELLLEEVDVRGLLEELREREAPATGVLLGEAPAGTVLADRDRLAQVVANLLQNARRHAGEGGEVRLSASAQGERLIVSVDDDGPGIDPAERERVFGRFNRSSAARERASGGSGLGLAIARSIVEAHGGRIWAESSPLGGARVSFEIEGFRPQLGTA